MKNEILDEIEKEIKPPKFALKSYDQLLTSILLYLFIVVFIICLGEMETNISLKLATFFSILIGTIGAVFNFLGILNYLKSRRNEENFIWKLVIGGVGNLLLLLIWIFVLIIIFGISRLPFLF